MSDFLERHPAMWNTLKIFVIFALVFVVCNQFNLFGVGIYSFAIDDESQSVILYYKSDIFIDIPKDDIQDMYLTEDFDEGEAVDLLHSDTYTCGIFENKELGQYKLFVRNNCDTVLVIKANDEYYAFNYTNDDSTVELYDAIERWRTGA